MKNNNKGRSVFDYKNNLIKDVNRMFPFMKRNNIHLEVSPNRPGSFGYLEAFPPGETGRPAGYFGSDDVGLSRPPSFPINETGIEIYDMNVSPSDLAGDVFTHLDKQGEYISNALADTINDSQKEEMGRQYLDYYNTINDLNRKDREEAALKNGIDALIRTSVFSQGGPNAVRDLDRFNFNIEQRNLLDNAKNYTKTGNDDVKSAFTLRKALGL